MRDQCCLVRQRRRAVTVEDQKQRLEAVVDKQRGEFYQSATADDREEPQVGYKLATRKRGHSRDDINEDRFTEIDLHVVMGYFVHAPHVPPKNTPVILPNVSIVLLREL